MAISRKQLIEKLSKKFPTMMLRTSEDYGIQKGGIWTSAEDGVASDGHQLINYYGWESDPMEKTWTNGVHNELEAILEESGWFAEAQDPGTYMLWWV